MKLLILFIILCILLFYLFGKSYVDKNDKHLQSVIENFGKVNLSPLYYMDNNKRNKYINALKYVVGKFNIQEKKYIELCKDYIVFHKIEEINDKNLLEISRYLFVNCENENVKCNLSTYIIKNSKSNKEILSIYSIISDIAKKSESINIRSKAIDILKQSNNEHYIKTADELLNKLRKIEILIEKKKEQKKFEFMDNIQQKNNEDESQVTDRSNTIPNRQNLNINIPPTPNNEQIVYVDENVLNNIITPHNNDIRNVYKDTQNVHNGALNESVLKSVKNFIKDYPATNFRNYEIPEGLLNKKDTKKVDKSLHRIYTDDTEYRNGITLLLLFQSVLTFIDNHKNKDELNKRLIQELIDMSNLCATGLLSRLLNVIQGYDNNKYPIKLSIQDELYAKMSYKIHKELEIYEYKDLILNDMTYNNKAYLEFIIAFIEKYKQEFYNDYFNFMSKQEIDKELIIALNNYIKNDIFILNEREQIALKI